MCFKEKLINLNYKSHLKVYLVQDDHKLYKLTK